MASVGAALDDTCRQVAAGIGHLASPHSSQWLQGCSPMALRSGADAPAGIAAATVMKPLAKMATQLRMAAKARRRFMVRNYSMIGRRPITNLSALDKYRAEDRSTELERFRHRKVNPDTPRPLITAPLVQVLS